MKVQTQTNLVKREGVWTFRKRIPQDLHQHYGKKLFRQSLGQFPALADAKREALRRAAHYEAEFEATRRQLLPAPARPLTAAMIPQLASALLGHVLTADEEIRAAGLDDDSFARLEAETQATAIEVRKAYARGDSQPIDAALDDWLQGLGLDVTGSPNEFAALRREFLKARLRALDAKLARNRGELVDTPLAPNVEALAAPRLPPMPATATHRGGPRLADVISYWKGVSPKSHRTTDTADMMVKEFTLLHGDVPLADISKGHFVAFRDQQLARVKPSTVTARFNLLRAAFTVCLEDDQLGIKDNPLLHVKIRKIQDEEKERDAFNADQLQVLFDSSVFTAGERPLGGRGEAAYWAPLIALFTGARLDEILSLRTDGLLPVDGVQVFRFRHRPSLGQSLKGKAKNNRKVPVHPELIRLGILDYLTAVSQRGPMPDGAGWLFPDIDRNPKVRNHSSAWGAWFGRYLTRLSIKTDKLSFHSFRHTFKHFSRASGIPEDHHDAFTGHTTAEVSRRYGSADGYPVEALAESMPRLRFGKLSLEVVRSVVWPRQC